MKKEEKRLIEIIRDVLAGKNKSEWSMQISKEEIERVIKCARVHGVLPFLQEYPDLPSYEIPGTDKTALSVFLSMAYNKSRFFQTTQTTSLPHTPAARLCMHNLSNKKTVFPDTVPP